jgi:magnesium transporter
MDQSTRDALDACTELRTRVQSGSDASDYLAELSGNDAVLAISRLSEPERAALFSQLQPEDAADLVEQMPEPTVLELVEDLEPETAARILEELPSDEQADIIGDLDDEDAEAILARLDPEVASGLRALAAYEDDEAGGIMVTEFLAFRRRAKVAAVIEDMRKNREEYADYDVQYAYVVERDGRLVGVLRVRDLLWAAPDQQLSELMIPDPWSVTHHASLEDVEAMFDEHDILGIPVVDDEGRLVGVVHGRDLEVATGERSDNDYLAAQGIVGGEELRTMPLRTRTSRRLAWLSLNIVLNLGAASVISIYESTLQAVIALAVFLPIISDMSGCSGNQAVAVSIRELSLGLVRSGELLRVWSKELAVGIVNGTALGCLVGLVAWVWKGNPALGAVVGGAMMLNTLIAVSIGGLVPLVIKRFGKDPALASGPILTTVTDICGFFLVLGMASMALPYLT